MSELSVCLEAIQALRDDMNQQHGRQSQRGDTLSHDVNEGFEKLRAEMRVQNGRVNALETRSATLEERLTPISKAVYGLVTLIVSAVIVAVVALVLK